MAAPTWPSNTSRPILKRYSSSTRVEIVQVPSTTSLVNVVFDGYKDDPLLENCLKKHKMQIKHNRLQKHVGASVEHPDMIWSPAGPPVYLSWMPAGTASEHCPWCISSHRTHWRPHTDLPPGPRYTQIHTQPGHVCNWVIAMWLCNDGLVAQQLGQ